MYYYRIVISKGTDPAKKKNSSKEYMVCHYCFLIMS